VIASIGVSAPTSRQSKGRGADLTQHVCDTARQLNDVLGA
jgi:DNA-binding IclR family transcriptional regulator